ncbi:hypothetical protein [Pseudonocardia zijingensis]|uniref:Uncharacterized protein n=1 Tax=Pseudonocardia zijingensis TaxID=153376 RepID=A0ABP3YVV1_9PSEU
MVAQGQLGAGRLHRVGRRIGRRPVLQAGVVCATVLIVHRDPQPKLDFLERFMS